MSLRSNSIFEFSGFRLDLNEKNLTRTGEPVPLTPKVFETLKIFVENAGRLIEKDELMEKLWHERFVEESNLTFNIKMLRKALGDDAANPKFIETVPKRGYRFIADVRRLESERAHRAPILETVPPSTRRTGPNPPANVLSSSQNVVALAEWRHETESKLPEHSNGHEARLELAPARITVTSRSKYLLTAVVIALVVTGLSYYFLYSAGGGAAIDSVAVLPFVNATGDTNMEYLSEGISDSIINGLSRLPNLKVNSLGSVLRYKGQEVDPQIVGRDLNVKAVLTGKMTRQADELMISVELVDVRDNSRLWGARYTRRPADILAFQSEIAGEISDGLRLGLSGEEKKLFARQHTENNEAFLFYCMGKYYGRQNTKDGFEKALEAFEHAVRLDPNYALAYTAIANTYQFMMSRGFLPPKEYAQKVEWAALKALAIDDSSAEAHASLGSYRLINFDWAGAEKETGRALELNPKSAYAHSVNAHYLLAMGRADDAVISLLRARELDATPSLGEEAFAYYMARQYDKAIDLYRKNLENNPANPHAHVLLGEAYVAKGMTADGVAAMEKGLALDKTLAKTPERWDRYPLMAFAYAADGRRDDALKILREQESLATGRYVSPYNFAIMHTALGDKDRAFDRLAESIDQRIMIIYHLKTRPIFDSLRSDTRYVELLRTMNLTP